MNNIAAAVGLANLRKADEWERAVRRNAEAYVSEFCVTRAGANLRTDISKTKTSAYWCYPIVVEPKIRDRVIDNLASIGIQASPVHYRNDDYSCFGCRDTSLEMVGKFNESQLNLPCGPWVTPDDIKHIARSVMRATGAYNE